MISFLLLSRAAQLIAAFLEDKTEQGLVALVFDQAGTNYVDFLKPRIAEFRAAMQKQDLQYIVNCTANIAGCGPGLTPASDDFLCGYLAALPQALAQTWAQRIAAAAAAKTNDISAAVTGIAPSFIHFTRLLFRSSVNFLTHWL